MLDNFFYAEKKYYPGFESFCDLNCIRLILEANGVEHSYLYVDASMNLSIDLYSSVDNYNFQLNESAKARSVIPEYLNKVKKYYYKKDVNPYDIYKLNIEKMERNNTPIAVGTDTYYLPYMDEYKTRHAWHTIMVCGIEKESEKLYVVDWAEPWFYHGKVSKEDFILARNSANVFDGSIYSGLPIENYWIEVEKDGWNKSPQELLSTILDLSLKQYFTQTNNEKRGITALEALYNDLHCIDESICRNSSELFSSLHRKLYISLKRHRLFKQYLENANQHVNLIQIENVIKDIDNIINKWNIVLTLILKISMVGQKKIINRLFDKMREVIKYEKCLGDSILKIYNEIK